VKVSTSGDCFFLKRINQVPWFTSQWRISYVPYMSPEEMRARADECERLAESLGPDSAEIRQNLFVIATQWRRLAENGKVHAKAIPATGLTWVQTG